MTIDPAVTNDDLQAFADDALPAARRAEVSSFLDDHPEAARYVERITAQNAALRAASTPYLDPRIPDKMRIAHLLERERKQAWFRFGDLAGTVRPQIAAALLVGLLVGGLGGWSARPTGPVFLNGVRPLAEEAADTYAVYGSDHAHPVEIAASDKGSLMHWASDRLRRPISAPDTIDDYKLLGGRVVATSRGPAAMFMYERPGGQRTVLMICPLSLHGTSPLTTSAQGALTAVSWSDQGVGYSIVGALDADTLQRLGAAVRRQVADKA